MKDNEGCSHINVSSLFSTIYKTYFFSGDVEDMSQFRLSSIRGSVYTPVDMYASVYKSQDKETKHPKKIDISNDCTNKVRCN